MPTIEEDIAALSEAIFKSASAPPDSFVFRRADGVIVGKGLALEECKRAARMSGLECEFVEAESLQAALENA